MATVDPRQRVGLVKTIGIIGRPQSLNTTGAVCDAVNWLKEKSVRIVVENETAHRAGLPADTKCVSSNKLPTEVDLILVLGGDGTLLSVAHAVACHAPDTPILAVNCGSLGFLTEITLPEMHDALVSVLSGSVGVDERKMFRGKVIRSGQNVVDRMVLNEVVIGKSARSNIINISISVRDHLVIDSRADGIIIATPTGSTAYNLAAGGPIVHPTVDAIIITPIAPHTLTNRPIVLTDDATVAVTPNLSGEHVEASASFDGQMSFDLEDGDVITIERAPYPLRVVRAKSRHYFAVLREKLKWGER